MDKRVLLLNRWTFLIHIESVMFLLFIENKKLENDISVLIIWIRAL